MVWEKICRRAVSASVVTLISALAFTVQAQTKLTVYTALEADDLKKYKQRFEAEVQGIEIEWVRDSTGVITAKLLAEKAAPKADVVFALAATSLGLLKDEGLLLPYAPSTLAQINSKFRDPANPPAWVGQDVYSSVVCFNTVEAAKKNLPRPTAWKDFTNPAYKGQIVMPHPASSGTGYLMVSAWLQLFGEKEGWKFMDGLHENVARYVHSGSAPCRTPSIAEFPIGFSFDFRANRVKKDGTPIDIIFPAEGLGWEVEAMGIFKTSKNIDAAKKLVDWAAGRNANELYSEGYAVVAIDGAAKPLEYIPGNIANLLAKNDFAWAAKNRERILAEWSKRYESKAAPK